MATTYTPEQYLEKYCPALYALGSGVYDFWLDTTLSIMSPTLGNNGWGTENNRNNAQALLAAHRWGWITGAYQDLGGGQISLNTTGSVTSEATGRESLGYGMIGFSAAQIEAADVNLALTRWGQMFLALRNSRPAFKFVVTGSSGTAVYR